MDDCAKITMLLYFGLMPDEETRLSRLDNDIATVFGESGIQDRAMWIEGTTDEHRILRLQVGQRIVLEMSSAEIVAMPDDALLFRVKDGLLVS